MSAPPSSAVCQYRFRSTHEYTRCAVKRGLQEPAEQVRRPGWFIRWVCGPLMLLILIGACGAYINEWRTSGEFSFKGVLGIVFFGILYLCVCWPGILRTYRFQLPSKVASSPHDELDLEARVSSSGIEMNNGISRTDSAWECYTRAKFFDDGILLESGPSLFTWLPDYALVQSSRTDAEAIIRIHVERCFVMPASKRSKSR